ncbi:hypothetical protein V6N13_074318 [Hibiscus sabdariffa]
MSSSLSAVMTWYRLCLLAGLCSVSSSSGLEGMLLPKLLPAVAFPFLRAGESGVGRSPMAEVAGVGAAENKRDFVIMNGPDHLDLSFPWNSLSLELNRSTCCPGCSVISRSLFCPATFQSIFTVLIAQYALCSISTGRWHAFP